MSDQPAARISSDEGAADTEPPQRLAVEVAREAGDWTAFEPAEAVIEAAARAAARVLALDEGVSEVVVALTSDAHMRHLNAAYRGHDKATNVLSFPANRTAPFAQGFLGDIALAAETVSREAAERKIPPAHHLAHLVIHGLLHLLGWDHESDADADEMEAMEARILARLGIPDPHAAAPSAVAIS